MFFGLSRREFLAYCGMLAGLLALADRGASRVAEALTSLARTPRVVWSTFMACTGCTTQLLQSASPGPAALILRELAIPYHQQLMTAAGREAREAWDRQVAEGGHIYVVEGAIPQGIEEALTVGGRPCREVLEEGARKARHVIAIGTCAAYGGIQAAQPDPTGAVGVRDALGRPADSPVVALSTCPGNGDALLAVLVHLTLHGREPSLDAHGRPSFLYGQTIHERCQRRGRFENGEFVRRFGTREESLGYCLLGVGCKGPRTWAFCPTLGWNGHRSWCVEAGPCIGCAEPGFWDRFAPVTGRMRTTRPGIAGISAEQVAGALGGAAAVGVGAHFIGEAATDRLPFGRGRAAERPSQGRTGSSASLQDRHDSL